VARTKAWAQIHLDSVAGQTKPNKQLAVVSQKKKKLAVV
jgi:hypothetical protein